MRLCSFASSCTTFSFHHTPPVRTQTNNMRLRVVVFDVDFRAKMEQRPENTIVLSSQTSPVFFRFFFILILCRIRRVNFCSTNTFLATWRLYSPVLTCQV